jgi:hypothetical protein
LVIVPAALVKPVSAAELNSGIPEPGLFNQAGCQFDY